MCFLRNGSSYSFETCTTAISMPENLRVHWLWPYKYKGKWSYSPKCIFSEMDNTDLKLVPLGLACLKTSGCTDFDPLNTKKRDVIAQNVFSQKWILIQLWNLHQCNHHAWDLRVCWVWPSKYKKKWYYCQNAFSQKWIIQIWPSKYKEKWSYSPKCVFSEINHHTALKLVPLGSACLKTSGCTEFDPLNTKESDVIAQNVFSRKTVHHTALILAPLQSACLKTAGCNEYWPSKYKGKWSL